MQNRDLSMLDANYMFAGRYRIVRRLASGGMGAVYEAQHLETGRACALKVMLAHVAENASSRERFRLEARAAAMVSSAHVVEVLDAGVDDVTGSPFLVMELLRGEDLASRVQRIGPHAPEEVAILVFQAARGLDALHRAAIVHRDLKPSNLFLAKRDDAEIVKVLDLGVAKRVVDTAATTAVVGTPLYMAPEQMSNRKISAATDEYALAMVAYTLLVGKEYWAGEAETATSSIAFALLTLDGPKEPATQRAAQLGVTLPAPFDDWFYRAAAADATARFSNVLDAALGLCDALGVDSTKLRTEIEPRTSHLESNSPHAPRLDALAPTMPNVTDERAAAKTITLVEGESAESRLDTAHRAKADSDGRPTGKRNKRRVLGGLAVLLLGMAAVGAFFFRNSRAEKSIVPAPLVESLHCLPAEIKGPGASPHLADALGKGACARLGIELGVPWLEPQGTPLMIHAEMHEDRSAHVVLEVAQQKAEGDGKTLMGATNAAIQKLGPSLRVPPMSPERIAGWGARDAASALRIERAMRQKSFGMANRLDVARRIVATDGDSPVSHAMLACALKNEDHSLAVKKKNEALQRLSQVPPKRAKLIRACLGDFIPTPDDPKGGSILHSYTELADDPDFASLFTMCGCVTSAASLPMADWLAKHAPVMGLPILPCTIGLGEANQERLERYLSWMSATLPELQGVYVQELVRLGKIDDARRAHEVLEWLGRELTTSADIVTSNLLLAFGSFDAKKAIAITEASMGEPDAETNDDRAIEYIQALLFAGQVRKGIEVADQRTHFLLVGEKHVQLLDLIANHLRLRRILNRAGPTAAVLERIEPALAPAPMYARAQVDVELALLRAREAINKKSNDPLETLLETFDVPDYKHAYTVPMVRLYRGNEAAAAVYREIQLVAAQRIAAFEAGLAFEAIGAKNEAERAYKLCLEEPWNYPFDAIAARVRLAEMAHATGREDEARALNAIVDRAWADADPDLRDIVRRLK